MVTADAKASAIKPIDLTTVRIKANVRSPLITKALSLDVGQGFEVTGTERGAFNYIITKCKAEGRSIGTKKLGQLHYLIFRYA